MGLPAAMPPGLQRQVTHCRVLILGTAAVRLRRQPRPRPRQHRSEQLPRRRGHPAMPAGCTSAVPVRMVAISGPTRRAHHKPQNRLRSSWIVRWTDYDRRWTVCSGRPKRPRSHRRRPTAVRKALPRRLVRPTALPEAHLQRRGRARWARPSHLVPSCPVWVSGRWLLHRHLPTSPFHLGLTRPR